jgi:hypothetical protein
MPVPVVPVRTVHSVSIRSSLEVSRVGLLMPVPVVPVLIVHSVRICSSLEVSTVGPVSTSSSGSSSDSSLCPDTQFSGSQ